MRLKAEAQDPFQQLRSLAQSLHGTAARDCDMPKRGPGDDAVLKQVGAAGVPCLESHQLELVGLVEHTAGDALIPNTGPLCSR